MTAESTSSVVPIHGGGVAVPLFGQKLAAEPPSPPPPQATSTAIGTASSRRRAKRKRGEKRGTARFLEGGKAPPS